MESFVLFPITLFLVLVSLLAIPLILHELRGYKRLWCIVPVSILAFICWFDASCVMESYKGVYKKAYTIPVRQIDGVDVFVDKNVVYNYNRMFERRATEKTIVTKNVKPESWFYFIKFNEDAIYTTNIPENE